MDFRLNRELKAHCTDFETARTLLKDTGTVFVEVKEQVDHYYHLPSENDANGTRRLKLRVENGRGAVDLLPRPSRGRRPDELIPGVGSQ